MKIIITITLLVLCLNQSCLNHKGQSVPWFLTLNAPGSVSQGYLYFDSTFTTSQFVKYNQQPDSIGNPIFTTLNQLNTTQYKVIAWNDQTPSGSTSSVKAHSKSVITYNNITKNGFAIIHSMPLFPDIKSGYINVTISDSQSIYGQHFLCLSTTGSITEEILTKSIIIRPNIYFDSTDGYGMASNNLFEYSNFVVGSTPLKVIYKNGYINGSIFQDGLTQMLNSDIIAQTWGRPIQEPWCGSQSIPYSVGNAGVIGMDDSFTWKQTQDHSKWAVPTDDASPYSCFGDMNRMSSQWKRGGSFYCLAAPNLRTAVKNLIKSPSICQ